METPKSIFDCLGGNSTTEFTFKCNCEQGKIYVRFKLSISRQQRNELKSIDWGALQSIADKVQIRIVPADPRREKLTLTLPASEAVEVFGSVRPCTDTYEQVYSRVLERKRYPMPKPEIPGGGKSSTAQGQTKKPGSHSHDKHK